MTLRWFLFVVCLGMPVWLAGQQFPVLRAQKFFDNFGEDHPARLLKSRDGHLLMGGYTVAYDSLGTDCGDIWIVKVDTTGALIWEREIALSGCEELRDMVETEDKGILFAGITTTLVAGQEKGDQRYWVNGLVGKIDSLGRVEWLQSYGGSNQDQVFGLALLPDAGIQLVGFTHSTNGDVSRNAGQSDAWALRIDDQGQLQGSLTYGGKGHDWALATAVCPNGDYLLAGFTDSPDPVTGQTNARGGGMLMRIDAYGRPRWTRTFACPQGGAFTKVAVLDNERILLGGHCRSQDRGQRFWWLLLSPEGHMIRESLVSGPTEAITTAAIPSGENFLLAGHARAGSAWVGPGKEGLDVWLMKLDAEGKTLWKQAYGGRADERGVDVIEYRPGLFFVLAQKNNQFTRTHNQDADFWLLKIEELPNDSIKGTIWVRTDENKVYHQQPIRFSARCNYGDRFLWDFGDGTTSTEAHPLKSYDIPGFYDITLTIFVNDRCRKMVRLGKGLEVW